MPYEYRRLTPEERKELVQHRLAQGYPPHAPPHPIQDQHYYLLTATCYNHAHRMRPAERRQALLGRLFEALLKRGIDTLAWVVLPNHYHLLIRTNRLRTAGDALRFVHETSASEWNAEESVPGRQVWYRYTDRAIRSEGHYYVTLNYIHYNPVKHRWAKSPYDWAETSVHWYLEHFGREWLRDLWSAYPLLSYGESWDDMPGGEM